jgi:hypothetical protein
MQIGECITFGERSKTLGEKKFILLANDKTPGIRLCHQRTDHVVGGGGGGFDGDGLLQAIDLKS